MKERYKNMSDEVKEEVKRESERYGFLVNLRSFDDEDGYQRIVQHFSDSVVGDVYYGPYIITNARDNLKFELQWFIDVLDEEELQAIIHNGTIRTESRDIHEELENRNLIESQLRIMAFSVLYGDVLHDMAETDVVDLD